MFSSGTPGVPLPHFSVLPLPGAGDPGLPNQHRSLGHGPWDGKLLSRPPGAASLGAYSVPSVLTMHVLFTGEQAERMCLAVDGVLARSFLIGSFLSDT